MSSPNSSDQSWLQMVPLKNLLKERINQDHGELVPIEGLPVKLSKEAIGEMFNAMFTRSEAVMRIAGGIAMAKELRYAGPTEIKQALEMEEKGVDSYLPQVWW